MKKMRDHLCGISVTDDDTRKTIEDVCSNYGIVLEPHGAVAWMALDEYLKSNKEKDKLSSVSLETAHPAKFPDEILRLTGRKPDIPGSLSEMDKKNESFLTMDNNYDKLKEVLLNSC